MHAHMYTGTQMPMHACMTTCLYVVSGMAGNNFKVLDCKACITHAVKCSNGVTASG